MEDDLLCDAGHGSRCALGVNSAEVRLGVGIRHSFRSYTTAGLQL